jgi:virulence factor Mce-like protein
MGMRTWRLVLNLTVFTLVAAALVAYGVVDLLGNPFASSTKIAAVFPNASGIYANFPVELNGVTVGNVSSVRLVRRGALVDMTIKPGTTVPSDVVANIGIANDLGEQVVELTPRHGGRVAALHSGALVPVAKNDVPVQVGKVVALATRLLRAIPAGKLNQLLAELATGLRGQAGNLRTIIAAGTEFSREFLRYQRQFEALLANSPPAMDAVTAAGPQLAQALANTEALVEVLARDKTALEGDLSNGQVATGALGSLTTNQAPDFACLVHDFAQLDANLDEPQNLSNISQSLRLNRYFFGAVTSVAVTGTAKPLASGQAPNPNQTVLRTRLLIPPSSEQGDTYSTPVSVPAVKPGAGCSTELGQGVGPASQPGFHPAAGGALDEPTAAEAQVRGRGDPKNPRTDAATQTAAFDSHPGPPTAVLVVLGGVLLPALALAWGVRPSRRRTRRRV